MCVTSLLCGPQVDLQALYGFLCKRFSLHILSKVSCFFIEILSFRWLQKRQVFFPYKSLYFECLTQQWRCSPMLIFRAWATCGVMSEPSDLSYTVNSSQTLIGRSPLVYSFNLTFPQLLQKLQSSTFLPQVLQNIPTTIPCAGTKWRPGQGRVKSGHSFRSPTADRLIFFLMSGFCI